jgi:RNA polymerase sigma-70 factor (ECF subfamily)
MEAEVDRGLVHAIAGASGDALSQLYDRYAPTVFGLARRIVGQPDAAEEVVQDVFAQIWREAPRYAAERGSVGAWIVTVARARAIDRLRAMRARPDLGTAAETPEHRPLPFAGRSPEGAAISADEARRVRAALTSLPETQRQLVELAYYEGLTHQEIAQRTGAPLGTVKTRLRAALTSLREVLPL